MKRWTKSMMAGLGLTVLGCVGCASDAPLEESNARESIKVAIKFGFWWQIFRRGMSLPHRMRKHPII